MPKRILLPLDGTVNAEGAVPYAVALAKRYEAELVLLRVVAPLPGRGRLSTVTRQLTDTFTMELARRYLCQAALAITTRQRLMVRVEVARGKPYQVIAMLAERLAVSLIVIQAQERAGWREWFGNKVARRVVMSTRIPVLVVRGVLNELS